MLQTLRLSTLQFSRLAATNLFLVRPSCVKSSSRRGGTDALSQELLADLEPPHLSATLIDQLLVGTQTFRHDHVMGLGDDMLVV